MLFAKRAVVSLTGALYCGSALAQSPAPATAGAEPAAPVADDHAAAAPAVVPPPAPVGPSAPTVPSAADAAPSREWAMAYAEAWKLLESGDFAGASARFAALANAARSPLDRELASQLGRLADTWRTRGASLVEKSDLEDSSVVARRENRRTTDEISMLYLNAAVYGLGTGGLVAVQTEADSPAGVILPALVLGGAGAGAVALIDSGKGLGYGVPQAIVSGMYIGLGEGITWSIWNQARANYYDEWQDKTVANIVWGGATLGAVGGGLLASLYGATPGRASFVGSSALWSSAVIGLAAGAMTSDQERMDDHALLAAAIGLNAGVIGGVLAAGPVSPSIARVRYLDLGGAAGGLVGGGLYLSAAGKRPNERAAMAFTALGIVSGLGLSWTLTNGMRADRLGEETRPATSGFSPGGVTLKPVPGGATLSAYGTL